MKTRKLGNTSERLSAIGLGCMPLSTVYGRTDKSESIKLLHEALDLGVNFWDTADMYGNGENEEIISTVLKDNRDKIFIATKFGFRFNDTENTVHSPFNSYFDGSPEWMRQAVELSLKRLKVDVIDL